jgi:hypothetical protein
MPDAKARKRKAAEPQPDLSPRWVNVFPIPNGAVPVTYGMPWARRPPRDMVKSGVRAIYRLKVTPKLQPQPQPEAPSPIG